MGEARLPKRVLAYTTAAGFSLLVDELGEGRVHRYNTFRGTAVLADGVELVAVREPALIYGHALGTPFVVREPYPRQLDRLLEGSHWYRQITLSQLKNAEYGEEGSE